MGIKRERGRTGPGALHLDILEIVLDELADARAAIDVGNDLEKEVRRRQRSLDGLQIGGAVLVAHGRSHHAHRSVVEGADERVDLGPQAGARELLGKSPELATTGNRRMIVEEHAVGIAALAPLKGHRDDLPRFRVVPETRGIGHSDELVFDQRVVYLQRLGHNGAQLLGIGTVGNDQIFAVDEAVGPDWKRRAGQRHGEGILANITFLHDGSLPSFWTLPSSHSRPSWAKSKVNTPS